MNSSPDEPERLTETEAKAGSKTLANRNVLIISVVIVVIIFAGLLIFYG